MNVPTNCPNCGAPITSCRCEYCGTAFRFQDGLEEIKRQNTLDSLLGQGVISVHDYINWCARPNNCSALIAYQIARQT